MLDTADQRLIHFDGTRQGSAFSAHHRDPKPLQHGPGHAIPSAKSPFEALGRKTVLGGGHVPCRLEPGGQRGSGLLQNRAGRHGRLVATLGAYQAPAGFPPRFTDHPTGWTREALRPPQRFNEFRTGFLVTKPLGKFTIGPRIVTASTEGCGRGRNILNGVHHYILHQAELTGHPLIFKTLNRARSSNRRVCRSRPHPKTAHTALGAVKDGRGRGLGAPSGLSGEDQMVSGTITMAPQGHSARQMPQPLQ